MGKNKPTMQDIANRLNISKNAVSLALNNKPGVSPETRNMVISLAKKLNYPLEKNQNANNILLFIPEYIRNDSHFYNEIYWSVDKHCTLSGYNAIMATITSDMEKNHTLPPICTEISFLGIFLIGVVSNEYVTFLASRFENILSIDQCYYDLHIPCVVSANLEGSYLITKNVLQSGHRKIGFIGPTAVTSSLYERWCGFQKAVQETPDAVSDGFCICQNSPLNVLLSDSDELCEIIKQLPELPTAFVCGGDRIAIACIDALQKSGISVPGDISVVGFDDIELSQFITPKLTTMHIKRKEMGRLAVAEFLSLVRNQSCSVKTSLYPEYIERDSLSRISQ